MDGPLQGLGKALARLREGAEVTLEEMANRVGVDVSGIRKLEGSGSNPQASTLSRYLMRLGADLHCLAASLDAVAGRERPRTPHAEPSLTSLGMAMEAMPDAPEEARREWALLHDEEQAARVRRYELRNRFVSVRT